MLLFLIPRQHIDGWQQASGHSRILLRATSTAKGDSVNLLTACSYIGRHFDFAGSSCVRNAGP